MMASIYSHLCIILQSIIQVPSTRITASNYSTLVPSFQLLHNYSKFPHNPSSIMDTSSQNMLDRVRTWFRTRRSRAAPLVGGHHSPYIMPIIPQPYTNFEPSIEISRSLGYDRRFQDRLLSHFITLTPPCLVYILPDDQLLEIHRDWFDSMGVPPSVPCLSWWSVVEQIRLALRDLDARLVTFGELREYLGMRLYPFMYRAASADEWQRWMVALDHLCQIVILVCCDPVEAPRTSLIRRLTSRRRHFA